jgi:hypothetical protein
MVTLVAVLACTPVGALTFSFETIGFANPSDCTDPPLPVPQCAVLQVFGSANDVGNVIPGSWNFFAQGQVLFGLGSGTFLFDDPGAANNDFFGSWTNVLTPPDPVTGIAQSFFEYTVSGGFGIFAGATGFGMSSLDVVVAPFGFQDGVPLFAAACPGAPARIGSFCERGTFTIDEPDTALLAALALVALAFGARSRARRASRGVRAREGI